MSGVETDERSTKKIEVYEFPHDCVFEELRLHFKAGPFFADCTTTEQEAWDEQRGTFVLDFSEKDAANILTHPVQILDEDEKCEIKLRPYTPPIRQVQLISGKQINSRLIKKMFKKHNLGDVESCEKVGDDGLCHVVTLSYAADAEALLHLQVIKVDTTLSIRVQPHHMANLQAVRNVHQPNFNLGPAELNAHHDQPEVNGGSLTIQEPPESQINGSHSTLLNFCEPAESAESGIVEHSAMSVLVSDKQKGIEQSPEEQNFAKRHPEDQRSVHGPDSQESVEPKPEVWSSEESKLKGLEREVRLQSTEGREVDGCDPLGQMQADPKPEQRRPEDVKYLNQAESSVPGTRTCEVAPGKKVASGSPTSRVSVMPNRVPEEMAALPAGQADLRSTNGKGGKNESMGLSLRIESLEDENSSFPSKKSNCQPFLPSHEERPLTEEGGVLTSCQQSKFLEPNASGLHSTMASAYEPADVSSEVSRSVELVNHRSEGSVASLGQRVATSGYGPSADPGRPFNSLPSSINRAESRPHRPAELKDTEQTGSLTPWLTSRELPFCDHALTACTFSGTLGKMLFLNRFAASLLQRLAKRNQVKLSGVNANSAIEIMGAKDNVATCRQKLEGLRDSVVKDVYILTNYAMVSFINRNPSFLDSVESRTECVILLDSSVGKGVHGSVNSITCDQSSGASLCVTVKHTQISVLQGDISHHPADVLVTLTKGQLNIKGNVSRALLSKAGDIVRAEMVALALTTPEQGLWLSSAGKLPAKKIFHIDTQSVERSRNGWQKVITRCLKICDDKRFTSIAFPTGQSDLSSGMADDMMQAFVAYINGRSETSLKRIDVIACHPDAVDDFAGAIKWAAERRHGQQAFLGRKISNWLYFHFIAEDSEEATKDPPLHSTPHSLTGDTSGARVKVQLNIYSSTVDDIRRCKASLDKELADAVSTNKTCLKKMNNIPLVKSSQDLEYCDYQFPRSGSFTDAPGAEVALDVTAPPSSM